MRRWIPIALLLSASACTDGRMEPTEVGALCYSDAQCDSGLCLEQPFAGICTRACADDCGCPSGYACQPTPRGVSACTPGANTCAAATDAGAPGGCEGGCPAGQVCAGGTCTALPSACPCPTGSYCDLATDSCLPGCRTDDHCGAGAICDGTECRSGCREDASCGTGEICDDASGTCRAGCRGDTDCPGAGTICDETSLSCRMGCRGEVDRECPEGFECNRETSTCEGECASDGDCYPGTVCEGQRCVAGCRTGTLCGTGCHDTLTDPLNCGGCGVVCSGEEGTPVCRDGFCDFECAPGETRCGDQCADLMRDGDHCGACGNACDDPYLGRGYCRDGACDHSCNSDAFECGDGCCAYGNVCCDLGGGSRHCFRSYCP